MKDASHKIIYRKNVIIYRVSLIKNCCGLVLLIVFQI